MGTRVSESTGHAPNRQMSAFGYLIAAILVVVLLPMSPILALVWLVSKVFGSTDESPSARAKRTPSA